MKKLVVGIASVAALVLTSVGMAAASNSTVASDQSFPSNSGAGIFVSGNLGYSNVNSKNSNYSFAPKTLSTSGFAWNTNIGYQFNKFVALEGGYTSLASVDAKSASGAENSSTLAGINFDAKGILPINKQFNLFAKAGAIDFHQTQTTKEVGAPTLVGGSAWAPEFGAGLGYDVTSAIGVSVQDIYTLKTSNTNASGAVNIPTTNSVLAGMSYKFNM